jgi:hypothetical protein
MIEYLFFPEKTFPEKTTARESFFREFFLSETLFEGLSGGLAQRAQSAVIYFHPSKLKMSFGPVVKFGWVVAV